MKRDIYDFILQNRDPTALHETPSEWSDRQEDLHVNYWMDRVMMHPSLTFLQQSDARSTIK
jgi:hypothetical protein